MYKLNGARMGPSVTNDTRMSDTLRFVAAGKKLSVDDILVPFVLDGPWRATASAREQVETPSMAKI